MGIWLPYPNMHSNMLVLRDTHLADVLYQGLDTLRAIPAETSDSRHVRMWRQSPGALLLHVINAEKEFRRRGLGEEPRVRRAFTWYYDLEIPLAPVPPWWYGSPMYHRSQRSHLIRIDPEWYARRLPPDTPLDMALLWPLETPHEWEMTGAHRDQAGMAGRGRNSGAHKERVRNTFRRKSSRRS